ncbi:hypothetical protein GH733_001198, partial [Mirounga leonina]
SSYHAPAVTQHAPYFKGTAVVNGEFKDLSLDDFKGRYLVLFFYPLDFTFVCPTEIIAFSDKANEFHDVNCEVVAVSVDSQFTHLAWINTPRKNGGLGHMNIALLSDLTKQISRDYGVLLEGPSVALRGLFIIDPNGVIKHLSVNDLPVGRSVEETLRLVKAFQFVETHGEVCPANWTPDSPTVGPRKQRPRRRKRRGRAAPWVPRRGSRMEPNVRFWITERQVRPGPGAAGGGVALGPVESPRGVAGWPG